MKRKLAKRLVISTVGSLLALVLAEWYLRDQVPACGVTPFRSSSVPGLSAEFRPGFTTLYKGFQVSFNSDGYRGPEFPARQADTLRVALVGDSLTFGSAVDLEDTLSSRLEGVLQAREPAQVLNFGVPGYSALNVAAVVEHKALAQGPDVVVYVFFANDVDAPIDWGEIPPDAVIDSMYGFPAGSALMQWARAQLKKFEIATGWSLSRRTPDSSRQQLEDGGRVRIEQAIRAMRTTCDAAGARLLVAVYPHLTSAVANPFRPIDEAAMEICRESDVEVLDLLQAFPGEQSLAPYWASVFDHHPNGTANQRVAERVAAALIGGG